MKAGELRQRVTIQEKGSVTRNSFGAEVVPWPDVATVWGAVEPLQGREFLEGQQATAEVTTRIRIRYRAGIVPTMRVVQGDHIYNILSVIRLKENRREIHLMCSEKISE